MKINVDASRISQKGLASLGYIMRDNYARVITTKDKQIGDCPILVAGYSDVR